MSNELTYNINTKGQLFYGKGILATVIGIPLATPIMFYFRSGKLGDFDTMLFSFVIFSPFALIALIPHLNYYFLNRKDEFLEDYKIENFEFRHKSKSIKFTKEDIDSIDLFRGFILKGNYFFMWPWSEYHHAVFHLKNGKSFVLSCLMFDESELQYFGDKVKTHKSLYRSGFGLRHNI